MQVIEVYSIYYHSILDQLDPSLRGFVDEKVKADKYYLVFKGQPIGGFGITSTGELTGLFSLEKGLGDKLFDIRLKYQLEVTPNIPLTLFCTGDKLKDFYQNKGFNVTSIVKWDDALAPKTWNYCKFDKPDLYYMEYTDHLEEVSDDT